MERYVSARYDSHYFDLPMGVGLGLFRGCFSGGEGSILMGLHLIQSLIGLLPLVSRGLRTTFD